ncbi:cytochrome P450 [Nocardia thailandica]|uniref:Cytochrome P450 n=1 Tax=Nocardia thailandica TaxID=257275 RepID=A0ABW6PGA4_9NOCA
MDADADADTSGRAAPRLPRWSLLHGLAAGLDFDRYLRRRAREGDPFYLSFPGLAPVLFSGTSDGARELFRAPITVVEPPRPNPIEPMVGTASLILTAGERHRADRAIIGPKLHGSTIRDLAEVISAATESEINWTGDQMNTLTAGRRITLRVILTAVFGPLPESRAREFSSAVTDFLAAFIPPLLLAPALRRGFAGRAPWDRFVAARGRLDRLILTEVGRRRREPATASPDLLDLLLATRYADGAAMTDTELCEQLRTLIVAGHETTATSLAWALYHLHRDPELLERARAEAATATDPAERARLPFLDGVCLETLRLHPPVPIVLRRLREPWTWRGLALPAGTTLGLAVPLLHGDPATFEQPRVFDPDRFATRRFSPFEYAPFGGGHRRCVGAALADYELRIVLATLLAGPRWALHPATARGGGPRAVPRNLATGPNRAIQLTRTQ